MPKKPLTIFKELPKEGYVRLPTILYHYPISKSVWWDKVKKGELPQGIKLSERITAWDVKDIRKLLNQGGE